MTLSDPAERRAATRRAAREIATAVHSGDRRLATDRLVWALVDGVIPELLVLCMADLVEAYHQASLQALGELKALFGVTTPTPSDGVWLS